MRLTVLVPSPQYLSSAGSRIRYQRLSDPLAQAGCELIITTIADFTKQSAAGKQQIILFSKVQDARGLALAHALRETAACIGVDLFDDYFSQIEDSRLAPQRLWLEEMARAADFFLCSTERMKRVATQYFGTTPGHVLNDPFDSFAPTRLASALARKQQEALERRHIELLWFGMGDNPSFPVGLHDLAHFGGALNQFRCKGFSTNLTVLTNARALDADGLTLLRRLPLPPIVEEWSPQREKELLEQCLAAFLPVNAQGFSIAKSLNRAVTALTAGAQVVTAGYPLYRPVDEFIYSNPEALVDDLLGGTLRVSGTTLGALGKTLGKLSDPLSEGVAMHAFLQTVAARPRAITTPGLPVAIVHGERSAGVVHKFARQQRWLSLGSPFTPVGLSYDAHLGVFAESARPSLRLTNALAIRLPAGMAQHTFSVLSHPAKDGKVSTKDMAVEIYANDIIPGIEALLTSAKSSQMPGVRMAMQQKIIEITCSVFTQTLGPMRIFLSEQNLPLCQAQELASTNNKASQ